MTATVRKRGKENRQRWSSAVRLTLLTFFFLKMTSEKRKVHPNPNCHTQLKAIFLTCKDGWRRESHNERNGFVSRLECPCTNLETSDLRKQESKTTPNVSCKRNIYNRKNSPRLHCCRPNLVGRLPAKVADPKALIR